MSESNPIRIFASHVFSESDEYLRLFEYLESVDNFFYVNCSKPDRMPANTVEALRQELLAQIKESEVLVVLGSLFDQKPDWVRYQIECARANKLPVVTVRAFGGTVVLSKDVIDLSDTVVDWNAREIVDAIRAKARNEDTNRWEVIDFP